MVLTPLPIDFQQVRGILTTLPNQHLKPVVAFLGLKYGSLENGELRFMPPKSPKQQWHGTRLTASNQPVCPQPTHHTKDYDYLKPDSRSSKLRNISGFIKEQSEECLYLNVYVPEQGEDFLNCLFVCVCFSVCLSVCLSVCF